MSPSPKKSLDFMMLNKTSKIHKIYVLPKTYNNIYYFCCLFSEILHIDSRGFIIIIVISYSFILASVLYCSNSINGYSFYVVRLAIRRSSPTHCSLLIRATLPAQFPLSFVTMVITSSTSVFIR